MFCYIALSIEKIHIAKVQFSFTSTRVLYLLLSSRKQINCKYRFIVSNNLLSVKICVLRFLFFFFFFVERFGFNSPSQRRFIEEQIKILVPIVRASGWFCPCWTWNSLEEKNWRCGEYGKNRLRSTEQRQRTTGLHPEVNEAVQLSLSDSWKMIQVNCN